MTAEPVAPTHSSSAESFFQYSGRLVDPVRADLAEAHRRAWSRLAAAGT